jgi:hypothetical protein
MKERNFNRNAFARAVFFFFQTQTLSLSLSLAKNRTTGFREDLLNDDDDERSLSPEQKSDDRADARDDDVHDDTKSAKREFETTKTVTHLLGVLDHHRWGSPRRTRTHHHHLVLDVYKLCFCLWC